MYLPDGTPAFWLLDQFGNRFQIVEQKAFFKKNKHVCVGVIVVSDMQRSISFYTNILGIGEEIGRFCYIEDPDGTLIELVETHKVPVLKKLDWFIDLKKRKHNKPLPDWMVGLLAVNKVK